MPADLISKSVMKKLAAEAAGADSAKGNARVKEVTERILHRMMQVIDECDVSMDEFWAAVSFIGKTAKNGEFGLMVPGVAIEHFLDLRLACGSWMPCSLSRFTLPVFLSAVSQGRRSPFAIHPACARSR